MKFIYISFIPKFIINLTLRKLEDLIVTLEFNY